jgi:N-acetylglucosamine-6-phosphate deacetylase
MLKALTNAVIFTGHEKITGKAILIRDTKIESIIDNDKLPSDASIIDCKGNFLAPGLIDLQIAGGGGYLFQAKPSAEALKAITADIVSSGTTGFLLAISTDSFATYHEVIRVIRDNPHPAVLGLHFEGPYLSPVRRGAHVRNYLKSPQIDEISALLDEAGGVIRMMTVAPDVCSQEIIRFLTDNGVVVAAGHSNATFREAVLGFKWGIRTTTHLFNGMSQLHHRDPGLPGAALLTENVCASIIADGIHVDYNVVKIAKKLMKERLFLVSDAVEENSTGSYRHVRQEDRFILPDGTLSGSKLSMMKAVKNCIEHVGISADEALRMASTYPAGVLGISDQGLIAPSFKANIVEFNKDFETEMVMLDGNITDIN